MDPFSVRPLSENEWAELRKIRLESLAKHPNYFSPSQDETLLSESNWRQRITNPKASTLGLFLKGDLVGITAVVIDRTNSTQAFFVSSYIQEAHRGKKLSKLFYEARIRWVQQHPEIATIRVEFDEHNHVSQKACLGFGFKYTSSYDDDGRKTLVFVRPI